MSNVQVCCHQGGCENLLPNFSDYFSAQVNNVYQPKVNVSPRLVFVNPVYTLPGGFSGIPQFIS
jgi:hypothetical protein